MRQSILVTKIGDKDASPERDESRTREGSQRGRRDGGSGGWDPGLSVSLSGKQYLARHHSATYTASTARGTALYLCEWRSRQTGPSFSGSWSSWFSTGTRNWTTASINSCGLNTNYLDVRDTDAIGEQATRVFAIYITTPC